MLAHKFKQLNMGYERDFEVSEQQKGTLVQVKKEFPDGNVKRIPQVRKFRIPRWESRIIAEFDVDNKVWLTNKVKTVLPFLPFCSIIFCPDKDIYVIGGLNDMVFDRTTFSS